MSRAIGDTYAAFTQKWRELDGAYRDIKIQGEIVPKGRIVKVQSYVTDSLNLAEQIFKELGVELGVLRRVSESRIEFLPTREEKGVRCLHDLSPIFKKFPEKVQRIFRAQYKNARLGVAEDMRDQEWSFPLETVDEFLEYLNGASEGWRYAFQDHSWFPRIRLVSGESILVDPPLQGLIESLRVVVFWGLVVLQDVGRESGVFESDGEEGS